MFLFVLMPYKYAVQKEVNPIGLLHAWPLITDTCALWYHFIGEKIACVVAAIAFTTAHLVNYHLSVQNAL